MAGFLFTGTARNEIDQEFYAEIDIEDGWKITPSWKIMEELLNDQYGTLSTLSRPAMEVCTANTAVRAIRFPRIVRARDYPQGLRQGKAATRAEPRHGLLRENVGPLNHRQVLVCRQRIAYNSLQHRPKAPLAYPINLWQEVVRGTLPKLVLHP